MSPADSPFAPLPAPGPHPATADLRAYAAGALAPAQQQRIEAHMLDCNRCADLVEGFSMTDATITDHAVATLRTRLQARIGTADPTPVAAPPSQWPRVAAAAVLLGAMAGGIWTWEQRQTVAPPATARLEKAAVSAPPAENPTSPAQPPSVASDATATAEVPVPPAPKAAQAADYAVNTPPRNAARRANPRGTAAPDNRATVADMEARGNADAIEAAPVALPDDGWASSQPVSKPTAASASAVPTAPLAKNEDVVLKEKAAASDTAAATGSYAAAGPANKAKAVLPKMSADKALAARVPVTPMPAGPAINPAPVGGTPALRDYLRRQAAEFEPENNALRLTGTVRIKFIVGADGKVSDLKITRGLRDDYDEEALRMICEGPAWQPGVAGGRRAPLPMEITVAF